MILWDHLWKVPTVVEKGVLKKVAAIKLEKVSEGAVFRNKELEAKGNAQ